MLNGVAPLSDGGDLLLELLLRGRQGATPRRRVGLLDGQRAQLRLRRGESGRLGQRVAPVLELCDGRVEVLDREQVAQDVGHDSAS